MKRNIGNATSRLNDFALIRTFNQAPSDQRNGFFISLAIDGAWEVHCLILLWDDVCLLTKTKKSLKDIIERRSTNFLIELTEFYFIKKSRFVNKWLTFCLIELFRNPIMQRSPFLSPVIVWTLHCLISLLWSISNLSKNVGHKLKWQEWKLSRDYFPSLRDFALTFAGCCCNKDWGLLASVRRKKSIRRLTFSTIGRVITWRKRKWTLINRSL